MAETTIEWAKYTFNPWEGCSRVSPGCKNCYAEARDRRLHAGKHWGPEAPRLAHVEAYWDAPYKWNRKAETAGVRKRVFCASLADVFEQPANPEAVDIVTQARVDLGRMIRLTESLDWLLLTKRPENWEAAYEDLGFHYDMPENVWVGVTAEDQKRADERIPDLLQIPAAKRFVSYEPALEYVNFRRIEIESPGAGGTIYLDALTGWACSVGGRWQPYAPLDQIIIGGESGPGARPFNVSWARRVIGDCKRAGVACFVKQLGSKPHFDEYTGGEFAIKDKKGGNWDEWPPELRVREYPV